MLSLLVALAQVVTVPTALDARWVAALDSSPVAPAGYDLERAYVPTRESLVALSLRTGDIVWRRDLVTAIAPTAGGTSVYVATDGAVESLASGDGSTEWRTPFAERVTLVQYDTGWLLCATESGDLAALRASDGELVWRTALGARVDTAPEPALDRVYLGLDGARVVAVDLKTGRLAWERTLAGRLTAIASTADQLIVGSTGREVVSLDPAGGRVRWRWRVGGDVAGRATSDDRRIYFVARDNVLRAVDRHSGNLRWYAELGARPAGGPAVLGGAVLVPLASTVEVFDTASGKGIGTIEVAGEIAAPPHVRLDARPTEVRLVATTRDGRIQGFGIRHEPPLARLAVLPGGRALP
jgi:outer membrane protein assembly factor BamB